MVNVSMNVCVSKLPELNDKFQWARCILIGET